MPKIHRASKTLSALDYELEVRLSREHSEAVVAAERALARVKKQLAKAVETEHQVKELVSQERVDMRSINSSATKRSFALASRKLKKATERRLRLSSVRRTAELELREKKRGLRAAEKKHRVLARALRQFVLEWSKEYDLQGKTS